MLALAVTLLAGVAPLDSAPIRSIHQLTHKTWSVTDGAPPEIRVLAQTGDGYLWLGTVSGLVRFDGVQFVPFRLQGTPALGVKALTQGRDGSLWIVWETGALSHLEDGRLANYGKTEGLDPVWDVTESSLGEVVAGTESGLALLTGGRWRDVTQEWGYPGKLARAVWFDSGNRLWAETADRVVYRPHDGPRFLDPDQKLRRVAYQADFDETADGRVWMAELGESAHTLRLAGDRSPRTEVRVGAFALVIDRRGSLWVGSRGDGLRRVPDLSRIRDRSVQQFGPEAEQFTEQDGLLSNVINDLLEDREGNIWVASNRGLERFREGSLVPFTTRGGLRPRSVFAARDSSVWTAAYAVQELTRIGPRGRDDLHEPPCWCSHLAQDRSGHIWGFGDTLLVRFQDFTPSIVRLAGQRPLGTDAIAIDSAGTVWLSDQALGLVRMVGNRLESVASPRVLGRASVLISDRAGRIWAGASGRITRFDHGLVTVFGAAEGVKAGQVTDLFEDRGGSLWATGAGGISRFESGRFHSLSESQSLPGRAVFGMRDDEQGNRWLAVRGGLLRLDAGELERAMTDTGHQIRYRTFDHLEGLPGVLSMTQLPVLALARDGKIWVGADAGVAYVDPGSLAQPQRPLHVLVEGARIDGRDVAANQAANVPPRPRDIEIDYTATALSVAERIQFRYRLDGADTAWREVGTRRRAYYTDLRPGTYHFRVSASDGSGQWKETGATWSFRVLPAWYQTLWFKALVTLLIGSIGGLVVWLIQRSRHAQAQADLKHDYEITLAERARIADDLHDTLLQGFTGVSLQLVKAENVLPGQPELAAETIARVQQLAQDSLREARERVWEMRETVAASDDLAASLETIARDRTAGTQISVLVSVSGGPRRLSRTVGDAVFRIGREAIVNAVRHAQPTRLEIHLDFRPNALVLEVRDDGRGLTPAEVEEAGKRGHFGIKGMRERAVHLGGRCEIRAGAEGGTVMALELPLTSGNG